MKNYPDWREFKRRLTARFSTVEKISTRSAYWSFSLLHEKEVFGEKDSMNLSQCQEEGLESILEIKRSPNWSWSWSCATAKRSRNIQSWRSGETMGEYFGYGIETHMVQHVEQLQILISEDFDKHRKQRKNSKSHGNSSITMWFKAQLWICIQNAYWSLIGLQHLKWR